MSACILMIALHGHIKAGAFFWDSQKNNPREGYHFTPDELVQANMNLNNLPPNYILTTIDPETGVARMALIIQDQGTGQWAVQYYTIESLPTKVFSNLPDAQRFAIGHLQSGFDPNQGRPQQQAIPSSGTPQKTVFPKGSSGSWRRAHLYR